MSLSKEQVRRYHIGALRYNHEKFIRHCWRSGEPFISGLHTKVICRLINKAIDDFRDGISTFLIVKVPFRHGKSDIVSRYLPPHFLGEFPDSEVMLATYASSLAEGFSRFARSVVRSDEYREIYPEVEVSHESSGVQRWGIEGHQGGLQASGLTSGLTGKGYHLGVLDDYCSGRQDAESEVIRNSSWEHFTNDFLTRRAPVSITIIAATPWHVDDIIGRIERMTDKDSPDYDANFPKFTEVSFPALNGDVIVEGERVKYEYLFPERFSPDWYAQQQASLGEYGTASLL